MKKVAGILAVALPLAAMASCSGQSPTPGTGNLGVWTPGGSPVTGSGATSGSSASSSGAGSSATGGTSTSSASSGGSSSGSGSTGPTTGGSSSGAGSSASSSGSSSSSSGGATSSDAGSSSGAKSDAGAGGLPCNISTFFASKCTSCHSDPPINGALSGLVTYSDLLATAKEDATKNEAQLSLSRIQNTASPMPPAAVNMPATAAETSALQAWINAGYPSGSCAADAGATGDSGSATTVVDVFSGQPGFTAQTGSNSHNAGQNCMSCHSGSGGDAPQFVFGGTIYDGNGNPVAGAEIRVVDKNGTGYNVYSGTNGTFHQSGTPLATPGHAGARNAPSKALMISGVTNGGCSSCHCTGTGCTTAEVHLP